MVNEVLAKCIAKRIYKADCISRHSMTKGYTSHNERSYMGSVAGIATSNSFLTRSWFKRLTKFEFFFGARDTHSYDGMLIFKYKNHVKIGVCESKLLRFYDRTKFPKVENDMSHVWNEPDEKGSTRFYRQVTAMENSWPDSIAKWYMFITDLNQKSKHPPFDKKGSTCFWHGDMHDKVSKMSGASTHSWTLNDIENFANDSGINLYDVVFDLLICKAGKKIKLDPDRNYIPIDFEKNQKRIEIPVPQFDSNDSDFEGRVLDFLEKNNLYYYHFADLTNLEE